MTEVNDKTPGLHSLPLSEYLADPCPTPSLNASVAHILAKRSPAHARHAHPRLGTGESDSTEAKWKGSLLHNLMLEGGDRIHAIELDALDKNGNMTTKAAKLEAEAAEASGLIPCPRPKLDVAEATARAISDAIRTLGYVLEDFQIEQTMIWQSDGLWFRARPDAILLSASGVLMLDLKTTVDAAPDAAAGAMTEYGYDISHAHYLAGAEAIWPEHAGRVTLVYLFAEKEPPHVVTPAVPDGAMAELGARKYARAVKRWAECLSADVWPGYSREPVALTPRGWELQKEGM